MEVSIPLIHFTAGLIFGLLLGAFGLPWLVDTRVHWMRDRSRECDHPARDHGSDRE